MINALHLIWIVPVAMVLGYIVFTVLSNDIRAYFDEQRVWYDDEDYEDDDNDTDDYGHERED